MRHISKKSGKGVSAFTLVEVIISIAILVIVIFASTTLLVSVIRSNVDNMNTLVAYGLAQEGLEGVRNMRDSNWLLNANFQSILPDGSKPFVSEFPVNSGDKRVYTLDYQVLETSMLDLEASGISEYAPWRLEDITVPGGTDDTYANDENTLLHIVKQDSPEEVQYRHGAGDPSLFHRFIILEPLEHSLSQAETLGYDKKIRVTSVVAWKDARNHEVRLTTELTDWKP